MGKAVPQIGVVVAGWVFGKNQFDSDLGTKRSERLVDVLDVVDENEGSSFGDWSCSS